MKLTDIQKTKILETRAAVASLQQSCDAMFSKLIKDIEFEKYDAMHEADLTSHISNPTDWVFDIVFNTEDAADVLDSFVLLEKAAAEYDERSN